MYRKPNNKNKAQNCNSVRDYSDLVQHRSSRHIAHCKLYCDMLKYWSTSSERHLICKRKVFKKPDDHLGFSNFKFQRSPFHVPNASPDAPSDCPSSWEMELGFEYTKNSIAKSEHNETIAGRKNGMIKTANSNPSNNMLHQYVCQPSTTNTTPVGQWYVQCQ